LPIIIIIILIIEFWKQKSEINPKYNKTVKVLEWLLIIVSIIILIHIFKSFMNNPHELLNKNTLYCFFLPIIYSILFYPFLYLFRLYMHYETLFVTIKHINSNKFPNDKFKEFSYIKKRRFLFCWLNLPKLIKFSKNMKYITSKYRDIDKLLERFRKIM
jgi:hypothetical protein